MKRIVQLDYDVTVNYWNGQRGHYSRDTYADALDLVAHFKHWERGAYISEVYIKYDDGSKDCVPFRHYKGISAN